MVKKNQTKFIQAPPGQKGQKKTDKKKGTEKRIKKKVPPPLHEEEEEEEEDLFMDFEIFWTLVGNRGYVAHFYREECECLWKTFTPEQQETIYDAIEQKLQTGRFVHYNPINAIKDNLPRAPKNQILSYAEYYARYGTTEPQDGWKQANPTGNKVIYVKN